MSVRESVFEFVESNGRTYHKAGKYMLPNDEIEQERLGTIFVSPDFAASSAWTDPAGL